jgi:hypothetical protein
MKLLLFLMVFVNVYIHFLIWTRIRSSRVTDPDTAKVLDPCGSGSTTLELNYIPQYRNGEAKTVRKSSGHCNAMRVQHFKLASIVTHKKILSRNVLKCDRGKLNFLAQSWSRILRCDSTALLILAVNQQSRLTSNSF